MIKVYALYNRSIVTEITNFCKTIVWSGDKDQVARKLEVTLAYSIWDKNQPNVQVGVGTLMWIMDEEEELFRGYVFDRNIISSSRELKFIAYNYLIYFTKSKGTYNFTKITPEAIAKTVCGDAGIQVGNIGVTGLPVSFIAKAKPFYEIIMQAFTYVWRYNGGKYNFMPYMDKDTFNIITMGSLVEDFVISPEINLGSTDFNDTLNNMVNKVNVYNDKGVYIGTAKNADWINIYGVLQDVYETNSDDKNPMSTAKSMLHGVDTTAKVNVIGDTRCKTGYAVKVKIPYIGVLADTTLYIDSDTHTWEVATGKYTMDLVLNTQCLMKLVEG